MTTAVHTKTSSREQTLHAATFTTAAIETQSLQRSERALDMMLTQRGDALAEVERVLAADPASVIGHCLRAALIVRADNAALRPALAASLAAIEASHPDIDGLVHRHATAARAWLNGDQVGAAVLYNAIVTDWPKDVVALAAAHSLDFHLGRRIIMRKRIAKVLLRWTADMFGYASVLAMYAFALEEGGHYRRAEKMARRALALDPGHPGAIHVVVHVMEMQGRVHDGLAFLASTKPAWSKGTGLSVHLAWHRALFHLDANNPKRALAIYDARIATADSSDMSALADGSALLWRLQLQGVDVGERWRVLADRWAMRDLAGARAFFVLHAMMAFTAAGRPSAVVRLAKARLGTGVNHASPLAPEESLISPLCEALLAFARGDYGQSVEWLRRVRPIANRCGGSLAQCDVIHLTFTEAALRARNARLARALVAERTARKPESRLNRLLRWRLTLARSPAHPVGLAGIH
jgi:tetratricopeptide (TPR) repeat protein